MGSLLHCSIGNTYLILGTSSIPWKNGQLTSRGSGKCVRSISCAQRRHLFPRPNIRLFPIYGRICDPNAEPKTRALEAFCGESTEEPNPILSVDSNDEYTESQDSVGGSETIESGPVLDTKAESTHTRAVIKREAPRVHNQELVPGATFTGVVKSIQPFGAFVDFGAFNNGLVHISRMGRGYVRDVGERVSVGQEVEVQIVEVDIERRRIVLSMCDTDDTSSTPPGNTSESEDENSYKRKYVRRFIHEKDGGPKRSKSKFVKGQVLEGIVKSRTKLGAVVTLPEGEEGFIPAEECEGFWKLMGEYSLLVGKKVTARVFDTSNDQVTLTVDDDEAEYYHIGEVHVPTNAFEIAFRKNKDMSVFLDMREKNRKSDVLLCASSLSGEKIKDIVMDSGTLELSSENENGQV